MGSLKVRNLSAETHKALRIRAAQHGRSMEAEIRARAARLFAILAARARAAGYTIAVADGQIAAIAAVHGFSVATRDPAPFVAAGVPVINPWKPASQD